MHKDAFDLWWEWADKPVDNKRRDRAKVNQALAEAERAKADSSDDVR